MVKHRAAIRFSIKQLSGRAVSHFTITEIAGDPPDGGASGRDIHCINV
jgi:hypothetical protein